LTTGIFHGRHKEGLGHKKPPFLASKKKMFLKKLVISEQLKNGERS